MEKRVEGIIGRMMGATNSKTKVKLAASINSSSQAISQWLAREKVPYDECVSLAEKEGLSLDWLIRGWGNPYLDFLGSDNKEKNDELLNRVPFSYQERLVTSKSITKLDGGFALQVNEVQEPDKSDLNDTLYINEYDVSFAAGWSAYADEHSISAGPRAFSRTWITRKGLNEEELALVRIRGDSMEPVIANNAVALLDLSIRQATTAMPIAFRIDNTLYVKRCQLDGSGNIMMLSVNKEYPPIIIDKKSPPEDFEIIGAVVWHSTTWV